MLLPSASRGDFLKAPSEDNISYPKGRISQPREGGGNAENPGMYTFLESMALELKREFEEVTSHLKQGFSL